jgi:DnaK suppressor protein
LEAQLKEATSSKVSGDAIRIHQVADPVDMTQEAGEREVAVQILDRESTLARRLRAAIDRVKDGSYGICLQCEEEIAPKRMKAIPWAELCIDCQERTDKLAGLSKGVPALEDRTEAA